MKNYTFRISVMLLLLFIQFTYAQATTETFFVNGNCAICKTRIESTAQKAGAETALWNPESKQLSVTFDSSKTSKSAILQQIASVGHDNEMFQAKLQLLQSQN